MYVDVYCDNGVNARLVVGSRLARLPEIVSKTSTLTDNSNDNRLFLFCFCQKMSNKALVYCDDIMRVRRLCSFFLSRPHHLLCPSLTRTNTVHVHVHVHHRSSHCVDLQVCTTYMYVLGLAMTHVPPFIVLRWLIHVHVCVYYCSVSCADSCTTVHSLTLTHASPFTVLH